MSEKEQVVEVEVRCSTPKNIKEKIPEDKPTTESPIENSDIQNTEKIETPENLENSNAEEKPRQSSVKQRNSNDRKLFVGALGWTTTDKHLFEYFKEYGEVEDVECKIDQQTNRCRGFGFVLFKEQSSVDAVLAEPEHKINGKKVDPKYAVEQKRDGKIFVGGLRSETTDETVKEYFEGFGPVENIERPYDKHQGKAKGFAFITFKEDNIISKVVVEKYHEIEGKRCEVKEAVPSELNSSYDIGYRNNNNSNPDYSYNRNNNPENSNSNYRNPEFNRFNNRDQNSSYSNINYNRNPHNSKNNNSSTEYRGDYNRPNLPINNYNSNRARFPSQNSNNNNNPRLPLRAPHYQSHHRHQHPSSSYRNPSTINRSPNPRHSSNNQSRRDFSNNNPRFARNPNSAQFQQLPTEKYKTHLIFFVKNSRCSSLFFYFS